MLQSSDRDRSCLELESLAHHGSEIEQRPQQVRQVWHSGVKQFNVWTSGKEPGFEPVVRVREITSAFKAVALLLVKWVYDKHAMSHIWEALSTVAGHLASPLFFFLSLY